MALVQFGDTVIVEELARWRIAAAKRHDNGSFFIDNTIIGQTSFLTAQCNHQGKKGLPCTLTLSDILT